MCTPYEKSRDTALSLEMSRCRNLISFGRQGIRAWRHRYGARLSHRCECVWVCVVDDLTEAQGRRTQLRVVNEHTELNVGARAPYSDCCVRWEERLMAIMRACRHFIFVAPEPENSGVRKPWQKERERSLTMHVAIRIQTECHRKGVKRRMKTCSYKNIWAYKVKISAERRR